jgi:repressor LexA
VRQQQTAQNGDIVVAMTEDDEATVKTFYKERDHIRLQPENSAMEPIRLKHVTILGKVIGLFRSIR